MIGGRRVAPALLAVALCVGGCTTGREAPSTGATTPATVPAPSPTPSTSPTVPPEVEARALLGDTDRAAASSPDVLRGAVATALETGLLGEVHPAWQAPVADGVSRWPVTVGDATVDLDGRVELELVLVAPSEADGELVLRWLPAATALGDAVSSLEVSVDGTATEVVVDRPGARLLVPVAPGRDHLVQISATYTVPERTLVEDDGSPAGYGLLARTDEAVMLGHWLPVVALETDDGPMQGRGDVGAFPPGAFWLEVRHDGRLVTGGQEQACPDDRQGCTLARGVGLRDLSGVLLDGIVTATAGPAAVHVPEGAALEADPVAREAAQVLAVLADHLGPLPWPEVDVVAAPLEPGALGMEFPGVVWVDPGAWPDPGPELGSYVLAHELAHQWFHALVGNGSLTAPVVDESIAQYLSVVAFDEVFGDGAGEALAGRSLGGRHDRALAEGLPDEPPAQPLEAFASARSYGANVYGRGGQAWVDAEGVAGRDAVLEALATLVERHGLDEVDGRVVLDVLREVAPDAAEVVAAGWGSGDG